MDKQPILSLCIPTNGAVQWVLPVLDSIYRQKFDLTKVEVVITDNGKDSQLAGYLKEYSYPNLRYIKTNDEGFLNLVTSLKEGNGLFCKMINHRSVLVDGAIEKLLNLVERYKDSQPIIYCSSGMINTPEIVECKNVDELLQNLSYWCSLSAGIGFWKNDISHIDEIDLNVMFPNTSMLFHIREDAHYLIWNYSYQIMADDAGKGGYDVFYTFAVVLLDLVRDLCVAGRVTTQTFLKLKMDLLAFVEGLYFGEVVLPTKHTFIIKDVKQSLMVYYGAYYYYRMVIKSYIKAPVWLMAKPILKIIRRKKRDI